MRWNEVLKRLDGEKVEGKSKRESKAERGRVCSRGRSKSKSTLE